MKTVELDTGLPITYRSNHGIWSRQGKRVILLVRRHTATNPEEGMLVAARHDLAFVGLLGIVVPPGE